MPVGDFLLTFTPVWNQQLECCPQEASNHIMCHMDPYRKLLISEDVLMQSYQLPDLPSMAVHSGIVPDRSVFTVFLLSLVYPPPVHSGLIEEESLSLVC